MTEAQEPVAVTVTEAGRRLVDLVDRLAQAEAERVKAIPKPRSGWDSGLSATEGGEGA